MSRLEKLALIVTILAGAVYLIIESVSRLPFIMSYLGFQIIIPPVISWGFPIVIAIVIIVLEWRFKLITHILRADVIIQKDSLRFYKYPYLVSDSLKRIQEMTNKSYLEIKVENRGKVSAKCSVEISLKGKKNYTKKILSSDLTIETLVDANHGTKVFYLLGLKPENLEAFLPESYKGTQLAFEGSLVEHGDYEILGKVLYDDRQSKSVSLGKIKIPDDLLEKAKIPPNVQVRIDQGGFAVYLELHQNNVLAKFVGHNNDMDVKKIILEYLEKLPQIDRIIEDNGKQLSWKIKEPYMDSRKNVEITDIGGSSF